MDAVLEDWTTAEIPEKTRTALRLLERMTKDPLHIDEEFVQSLRSGGLDDDAIREAANVSFHYNLINRVADAFDFPIPNEKAKAKLARMLNLAGKMLKGSSADRNWSRGSDGRVRPPEVDVGREHLLTTQGKTDEVTRRAVEAFVMAQWSYPRPHAGPVPPELENYLRKLSLHAYKIVDSDIEDLRTRDYDDDAIYEITIVGSMAAALIGLECLYEAMYGHEQADVAPTEHSAA